MTEDEQETADQDGVVEGDETEVGDYILKFFAFLLICAFFVTTSFAIGLVFRLFDVPDVPIVAGLVVLVLAMLVGLIAMAIKRNIGVRVAVGVSFYLGFLVCGGRVCWLTVRSILCGVLIGILTWVYWKVCGRIWRISRCDQADRAIGTRVEEQEPADQDDVAEGYETEVGDYIRKFFAFLVIFVNFVTTSIVIGLVFRLFDVYHVPRVGHLIGAGLVVLVPAVFVGIIAIAIKRNSGVGVAVGVSFCIGFLACGVRGGMLCGVLTGILTWVFWKGSERIWRIF